MSLVEEISKELIKEDAFCRHHGAILEAEYSTDDYSEGIKRLCIREPNAIKLISELTKRFFVGDYGSMYEQNEKPSDYLQEGYYETEYGVIRMENRGGVSMTYLPIER